MKTLDLVLALVPLGLCLAVGLAYAVRMRRSGRASSARVDRMGGSVLLGKSSLEMGSWALQPLARGCVRLGISANAVSWSSLALGLGAGAALALGAFGLSAVLLMVSSLADALDGQVARASGTASDAGEVLDAGIDRYNELALLAGAVIVFRDHVFAQGLALAALSGAFMVSYATAKAEALQVPAPRGAMRRPERAVYLVLGTLLTPVVAWLLPPPTLPVGAPLLAALLLIGVVGNVSAVRRLAAIARSLRERAGAARATAHGPTAHGPTAHGPTAPLGGSATAAPLGTKPQRRAGPARASV